MSGSRRCAAGWALAGLLLMGLSAGAQAANTALPVRGLIVQLRDAPAHQAMLDVPDAQVANSAGGPSAAELKRADGLRWARLMGATGLTRQGSAPSLQPVGRAAQRLRWDTPPDAATLARWQTSLAARPEVAWVVPDTLEPRLQAELTMPDDPLFGGQDQQWWLQPVSGSNSLPLSARLRGVPGVQTAWSRSTGDAGPVVAVLDTGLTAHPEFDSARLLPGYDMVSDWDASAGRGYANDGDGRDADPSDPGDWVDIADQSADAGRFGSCSLQGSSWHGTTVTGIIAASSNNALGVAGLNWGVRILPVRVAGKCGATVSDIVDGMRWAAGLQVCKRWTDGNMASGCAEWAPVNPTPARVVNISFGGASACNAAYQSAIDELWALGVLVVAAGGNDHASPSRPANCQHVLGVAALNRDGFKASYSNFGSALALATVGGDDTSGRWGSLLTDGGLLTLGNSGSTTPGLPGYGRHTGTSFAAPVVAGVAAQMLSLAPGLDAAGLLQGLSASARPHVGSALMAACSAANPGRCVCSTATCGAGILDADQALRYAQLTTQSQAYQAPNWAAVQIDTSELRAAVALGQDREAATSEDGATSGGTGNSAGGSSAGGGALDGFELAALAALLLLQALGQRLKPARKRSRASPPSGS